MAKQTTTTVTQQQLPEWYNQFATNTLSKAYQATSEPYQAYGAPRIAGFAPEQEQAFQSIRENVGAFEPYVQKGANYTQQAREGSAYKAANPYIQAGTQGLAAQAALPFLTAGATGSSLGAASPYLGSAMGSFTDEGVAQRYMNPYIQEVVQGIGSTAARNLYENILPNINRTFVGGGTFGGSRSAEFMNRAIRDTQASALSEQVKAMREGYREAADLYGTEASRRLAGAGTIGELSSADLNRLLTAGGNLGELVGAGESRMLTGAGLAGQYKSDDLSRRLAAGEQMVGIGSQLQNLYGRDAAALEAVGGQRQQLAQTSADLAYQDFLRQQGYPLEQARNLAEIGAMLKPGEGTTLQTTSAPGASKTASTIGAIGSAIGTIGSIFAKDGGKISHKRAQKGIGWLKEKK